VVVVLFTSSYFKVLDWWLLLIVIFFTHMFDLNITHTINFVDWTSRLDLSDSVINWFNFFWTSNTYLSGLSYTLILLVLLGGRVCTVSPTTPTLLILAWTEGWDFLIVNISEESTNLTLSGVNTLLTNNLNKYHPLLLYISSFLLILSVGMTNLTFELFFKFSIVRSLIKYLNISYYLFGVNFIALLLGSWWALQEGTWGGWWNWDASEVLGLLILLLSYTSLHFQLNFYLFSRKGNLVSPLLTITLLSYFFIQLNFELTSHSFGNRFTHFFNNNLFFFELVVALTWVLNSLVVQVFWWKSVMRALIKQYSFFRVWWSTSTLVLTFILVSLITIVLALSYTPLMNYFLWRFFRVNSFNWPSYIHKVIFCLTVILGFILQNLTRPLLTIPVIVGIYFNLDYSILHLLMTILLFRSFYLLHWFVLILLVLNIWSYNLQFAYWLNLILFWDHFESTTFVSNQQTSFTCHNFFVDKTCYYSTNNSLRAPHFNFSYKSNSLAVNDFLLLSSGDTFTSLFFSKVIWSTTSLLIELPTTNTFVEALILTKLFLYLTSLSYYWGIRALL